MKSSRLLALSALAPESVDLQAAHYTDFVRAVLDKIATVRFVPGRIGSCPVATWETQSFVFKIP